MSLGSDDSLARQEGDAFQEAADWFMRTRQGLSVAEQTELLEWMRRRPENAAAADIVSQSWDLADQAARSGLLAPELLRARRLGLTEYSSRPARRRFATPSISAALLAATALVASAAACSAMLSFNATYATKPGDHLAVALPDGTRITLDAASRLDVRFDAFRRRVRLVSGEAEIDVGKQRWRPFRLAAKDVQVLDRGTRFTARVRDGVVRVVLLQGAIDLHDTRNHKPNVQMSPGEQAVVDSDGITTEAADLPSVLAWREGELVLNDTPLSDALKEFSARTGVEISVADPDLGRLRVGGVYRISDAVGFMNSLHSVYPISWREVGPGRFELRRDAARRAQ